MPQLRLAADPGPQSVVQGVGRGRFPGLAACLAAVLLVPAGVVLSGEGGPAGAGPAPGIQGDPSAVPEWALARLRIRALGGTFEKIGRYVNKIVENSGALLVQSAAAAVFFPIPQDRGVAPDQPALIFLLPPAGAGAEPERGMLLPVADPKALKESLEQILGATQEKDYLALSVPQGFDRPEKRVLVRIRDGQAAVGPDEPALNRIAACSRAAVLEEGEADLSLRLNPAALRKAYQPRLEALATLAAALVPGLEAEVGSAGKALLGPLAQLGSAGIHIRIEEEALRLHGTITALPGTSLAELWGRQAPPMSGKMASSLPKETVLFFQAPVLNLLWVQHQALAALRRSAPREAAELVLALENLRQTLLELEKTVQGEVVFGLRAAEKAEAGVELLGVLGTGAPEKASLALERLVLTSYLAAVQQYKAVGGPGGEERFLPVLLRRLPQAGGGGGASAAEGYEIAVAEKDDFFDQLRSQLDRFLGLPVTLHWLAGKDRLVLAAGRGSQAALPGLLRRGAEGKEEGLTAHPEIAAQVARLEAGTDSWTFLRPLGLLGVLARRQQAQPKVDWEDLAGRLPDAAVQVLTESGAGGAGLRIELPAQALEGLAKLFFRAQSRGVNLYRLFLPRRAPVPKSVPAPPPSPQD